VTTLNDATTHDRTRDGHELREVTLTFRVILDLDEAAEHATDGLKDAAAADCRSLFAAGNYLEGFSANALGDHLSRHGGVLAVSGSVGTRWWPVAAVEDTPNLGGKAF
jgi:hypothetical protein